MTEHVILNVKQGLLRGKVAKNYLGDNYYSFQGIPYAKPPVGNLRFKDPVSPEIWDGIFDATKEGPECPSAHMLFLYYVGQEDNCLNLNVYTRQLPSPTNFTPKPVMVWIHGGAFLHGCNKTSFFGPDYLMTEDVIQVAINYRLGILGFLAFKDETLEVPGNAGLKDMVCALQWVKENISKFGGDPNNVTIFGESAGSASVEYLILSPLAKGLFHKAILQSGSSLNPWARGRFDNPDIVKILGLKEPNGKSQLEHLQRLSTQKLVSAQMKMKETFSSNELRNFAPVIEKPSSKAFISQDPIDILKSGEYNKVPIIFGATSNEGLLYEVARKTRNIKLDSSFEKDIPYVIHKGLDQDTLKEVASKIKKFYFNDEEQTEDNLDRTFKMKSDNFFLFGIHQTIGHHLEASQLPMYFYIFSYEGEFNFFKKFAASKSLYLYFACHFLLNSCDTGRIKNVVHKLSSGIGFKNMKGVCHADDLGYLFNSFYTPKVDVGSTEEITIKRFVKMWTNFARYGNPTPNNNKDDLLNVEWKPLEKGARHYLDIGENLKLGVNPFEDRMHFWEEIFSQYKKP